MYQIIDIPDSGGGTISLNLPDIEEVNPHVQSIVDVVLRRTGDLLSTVMKFNDELEQGAFLNAIYQELALFSFDAIEHVKTQGKTGE